MGHKADLYRYVKRKSEGSCLSTPTAEGVVAMAFFFFHSIKKKDYTTWFQTVIDWVSSLDLTVVSQPGVEQRSKDRRHTGWLLLLSRYGWSKKERFQAINEALDREFHWANTLLGQSKRALPRIDLSFPGMKSRVIDSLFPEMWHQRVIAIPKARQQQS